MQGTALESDRILTEAAEWLASLNASQVGPAISRDFVSWLMRSSDHVDMYLKVSRVYGDMSGVPGLPSKEDLAQQVREADESSNVVAIRPRLQPDDAVNANEPSESLKLYRFGLKIAAAACVAILALLGGWFFVERWGYPMSPGTSIRTPIGEQRSLSLEDGSVVHLNTDTAMTIRLSSSERRVRLNQGEARFTVAKDSSRPFIVTTPQAIVRALGTEFNVRIMGDRTIVSVVEGHVDVTWRDKKAAGQVERGATTTVLGANHQATVLEGIVQDEGGVPFSRALQWSQRRLLVREERLADVIAEFNRYHKTPMLIEDAELRDLQISGEFQIDDRSTLLDYLRSYEGVSVVNDGSAYIVRQDWAARRNP